MKANAIKRKQYEEFLAKVDILENLSVSNESFLMTHIIDPHSVSHTNEHLRISNVVKLQMLWSRKNLKKMTSLLNR